MRELHLRVVDYVANLGGGVRFATETIRALLQGGHTRIEVVGYGRQLDRYRLLLPPSPAVEFRAIRPRRQWQTHSVPAFLPGARPLTNLLGMGRPFFDVPDEVFDGAAVVWFPWVHHHRIPWSCAGRAVGSLHDVIAIEMPGAVSSRGEAETKTTVESWLASEALIVVSSKNTITTLGRLFGVDGGRLKMVPLSGQHDRPPATAGPFKWPFLPGEYLFYPANVTRHKNHEVLLAGVGGWGAKRPLVLSGGGTKLWAGRFSRQEFPRRLVLRRAAEAAGLQEGQSLFGLGYVSDADYYTLLDNAWALVMPTLAEGGGSFPVMEALIAGIPVVASDIPVMREMMERTGGEVLWFDAGSAADLASKLEDLETNYPHYKARAVAQSGSLRMRTWADVAADYREILSAVAPSQVELGRAS